ncbi:unnamed protein product, partial [marine sediment metagenome]
YDKGGLPLSVAMHTWFNFLSFTSRWMAEGGILESSLEEGNSMQNSVVLPPLMLNYSIRF